MKNPKANALRWFRQAEYDLDQGLDRLERSVFSYAAFFAEQSAQKSLKAFLIFKGKRVVAIHSVGELAKQAAAMDAAFIPILDEAKRLDRHYLASRYPDALPDPAIPAESYVRAEAEEAIRTAQAIFAICRSLIPE